jgi:hypothetical protein
MTGLDTRVVTQVLEQNLDSTIKNQSVNPENALIDMWSSDSYFQDSDSGQPSLLPIAGKGKTFQGLVLRSIGRNITVKTVMDRLLNGGSIKVHSGEVETVELISRTYLPLTDDRVKHTEIAFLEASRVLGAVIYNMNSTPDERVPQQGRWTYRLSPDRLNEFRNQARILLEKQIKEGEVLLEQFEEPKKQPGQVTVGFGWYQWSDHDATEEGE